MMMSGQTGVSPLLRPSSAQSEALDDAKAFLEQYAAETERCPKDRFHEVFQSLSDTGTYEMTSDELTFAAKLAWRNNTRCIGRLFWQGLIVRDMRHLDTEEDIFEALVGHLREATGGGKLRPMITLFAPRQPGTPGIRIWNHQLVRYAGYRKEDGTVIGDPLNAELTEQAMALGWKGRGGPFDILPVIVQLPGRPPRLFELPEDAVLEVNIEHPDLDWFADLGLKWHALPAISDMMLDAGGLQYTAAPFSGWYMGTEIGSRNFGDEDRYNMLPVIAEHMGLSTRNDRSLWKDRALLELNTAVLYSFKKAGVSMVDHHAASKEFMRFAEREELNGRPAYGNWSWIVPPMSGSACPVFHREFVNESVKPNYFYQEKAWAQR